MQILKYQPNIIINVITRSKGYHKRNVSFTSNVAGDSSELIQKLNAFQEYESTLAKNEIQREKHKKETATGQFEKSKQELEKGNNKKALQLYQNSFDVINSSTGQDKDFRIKYFEFGGDVYQGNGALDKAGELYQRSMAEIALKPNNSDSDYVPILNKLARNYMLLGEDSVSNELLDRALNNSLNPEDTIYAVITRLLSNEVKKSDAAGLINYLNTLEELYSFKPDNYLQLMSAYLYRSQKEYRISNTKADEIIADLSAKGNSSSQEYMQAILLKACNNYDLYKLENSREYLDKSVKRYEEVLKIAQDNNYREQTDDILLSLGQIYYGIEDYAKSQQYLSQISKDAPIGTVQKCLGLLGDIAIENKDFKTALNYFEAQRKALLSADCDSNIAVLNLERLIASAKQSGNIEKMQQYTDELDKMQTSNGKLVALNSFDDLLYLGTYNADRLKNDRTAQKYFIKALNTANISDENRATAQIYLGISQIKNDEVVLGIQNAKEGCQNLETIVQNGKFKNENAPLLLFMAYFKLGELHYFERSEYKNAAQYLQKALNVAESQNLFSKMNEDDANKLYLRLAAAYYKAQDYIETNADYIYNSEEYRHAEEYFGKYLKNLTDGKFNYNSLNDDFVDYVIDNRKTSQAIKIATSLEMLGVVCTKNRRFQTALKCFETSLKIRRKTRGNKVDSAKDLLAIARVSMIGNKNGLSNSKEILEEAVVILRKELGENHPDTQKEIDFINKYYGANLTSAGKYLYKGVEFAKNKVSEFLFGEDNNNVNNWEREIMKDFHLIYKDLDICE